MVHVDISACDECGTCISVCPEGALALTDTLAVDPQKCISCSLCVKVCPFAALHLTQEDEG